MKYEKLSKLFIKWMLIHMRKNLKREQAWQLFNIIKHTGFRKGRPTDDSFELFYVNTHSLMKLNNEVLLNSSKISSLISQLPNLPSNLILIN